MRILISLLLGTASLLSPITAFAGSADVEATISAVNVEAMNLTLDDGKTYTVPDEFNFEGLEKGQKVIVFYTEVDGKRVIDDLEVLQ
jgi:Cu/Ag efflux protein CusF